MITRLPAWIAEGTLSSEVALVGSVVLFLIILVALFKTPRRTIESRSALPLDDGEATPACHHTREHTRPHGHA